MAALQQAAWDLRSFPQGIRNCYSINIMQDTKYLIRGTFFYGNYDGLSKLPQFDLHLGVNKWDTVKIENVSVGVIKELIHVPSQNYLQVCLVNTGLGMPFISAIELRPLNNKTYVTISGSLALFSRYDFGSLSRTVYRSVTLFKINSLAPLHCYQQKKTQAIMVWNFTAYIESCHF